MSVSVQSYSVQFVADPQGSSQPSWNYWPSAGTQNLNNPANPCSIMLNSSIGYAVVVLNLQPMSQALTTVLYNQNPNGLLWTVNGVSQSAPPNGVTVNYSADGTVLILTDDNDNDDSYGFTFQVTYSGQNYTSPDPIIVNKDTGDNPWHKHHHHHRVKEDVVEIQELIAVAQTRES